MYELAQPVETKIRLEVFADLLIVSASDLDYFVFVLQKSG